MKYKIYNQDVLDWTKTYNKAKFHALLCDPPYHLTTITKRFGKNGSAPAKFGTDGVFQRASRGFMGQEWDGGDIAFNPETWALLGEHLYDGAFGFVYAASRNWHKVAGALEGFINVYPEQLLNQADLLALAREEKNWNLVQDVENWLRDMSGMKETLSRAGFIIHPTIFCWVQGQGFPKATRIDKKANDKTWEGHRYGLQALKPAVEPIICFQKSYNGRPLDNITQTGAGALNIDAARIPLAGDDDEYVINTFDDGAKPWGDGEGHKYTSRKVRIPQSNPQNRTGIVGTNLGISNADIEKFQEAQRLSTERMQENGRWPANFVLYEETAKRLDRQSGNLTSGDGNVRRKRHETSSMAGSLGEPRGIEEVSYGDTGGASRFFFTVLDVLDESDPIFYSSKTSPTEKEAGLIGKFPCYRCGQLDSTHHINENGEEVTCKRGVHPTYKPISLNKWLATLLLPPDMYAPRRLLVPFSGVGSEMIGGMQAGWDRIVGIESDTKNKYVDMSYARLDYYRGKDE